MIRPNDPIRIHDGPAPCYFSIASDRGHAISVCLSVAILVIAGGLSCSQRALGDDFTAKAVTKIVGQLKSAMNKYKANPTLENKIRVATWRIMLGEVATEGGKSLSLWSVALDEFDAGSKWLREIEIQIAKSPELERRISNSHLVAMRLDATRVRRGPIAKRTTLARKSERARLNQLREIAKAYRTLLEKGSQADLYFRLADYERARQANIGSLKAISKIYDIAASRNDYYLFKDEPRVDPDSDFKAVQATTEPLGIDVVGHAKVMHSLATFRLAVAGKTVDRKLLEESRLWAFAAVNGGDAGDIKLPKGKVTANPIAHYVLGLVNETLGTEMTRERPARAESHRLARTHFNAAKSHFAQAKSVISTKYSNNKTLATLAAEITAHAEKLTAPKKCLKEAQQQTVDGRPREAMKILGDGVLRHRDTSLWLELIDNARRARVSRVDLRKIVSQASEEKVFEQRDVFAQIALTKVATELAWNEIAEKGAAKMPAKRRARLRGDLQRQTAALKTALAMVDDEVTRAQGQAVMALSIAYQTILSPSQDSRKARLGESHRLARDAMVVLATEIEKQKDAVQRVKFREALIASRLAYGHVAMQMLPKYRDDALLAFAAAFDEMAKLPYHTGNVKILGSPMITALAGRDGESGGKLAIEERRYRQLVTRFLEGMYALQFGNAAAAADQMTAALRLGERVGKDQKKFGPRDATVMLGQADGFDAKVTLQDTVKSFKILADIKAGRHDTAFIGAVQLLVPNARISRVDDINQQTLEKAVRGIQSPLVGYALASALEAHLNSLGLGVGQRREILIAQTSAALSKVNVILRSRRMQDRYPHLVAMAKDIQGRFSSADQFRKDALKRRGRADLSGAIEILAAGIRIHSRSEALWQLYFETKIEQVRRGNATAATYSQLLKEVVQAAQKKMLSPYLVNYYSAVLYERLGRSQDSLIAYESALARAVRPKDRIIARSKVSELRIRLASNGQ